MRDHRIVQFSVHINWGHPYGRYHLLKSTGHIGAKARATLAQPIDAVCENHEPVIITKKNDRSVVMLSLEDYQALEGNLVPPP